MHVGIGKIVYYDNEQKVNVLIEDDLVNYYRSLVPKWIKLNKTKFTPHITVVRNEKISNQEVWKRYEEQEIEFQYDNVVFSRIYWWLPVYCEKLTKLRIQLGLSPSSKLTRPPDNKECFHITIGNLK